MNAYEATDGQRGIGIAGVPSPQDSDPILEGWSPGLPQTTLDATAILYTAISQFMNSLPVIFEGTILGLTFDGETVMTRFPDGRIWAFQAELIGAASFVTTELIANNQNNQADKS